MTKFTKKILAAASAGTMFLSLASPVLADNTIEIIGNGYDSENEVEVELENETSVYQHNKAIIINDIDADAETGENDANQNTGGDVLIGTGDAKTWVEVDNMVNFNSAEVDCGCLLDLFAKIGENGADTENEIEAELESEKNVYQGWGEYGNFAFLLNDVDGDSETGENDVDQNTGDPEGDPGILTGDALDHVAVSNSGNVNIYGDGAGFEWPELPEWPEFDFSFSFNLSLSQLLGFLGLV